MKGGSAAMYRRSAITISLLVLAAAAMAGCGSSAQSSPPPAGQLVHVPGSSVGKIVLSAEGAQHIGLETSPERAPFTSSPSSRSARAGSQKL